MGKFKPGDKVIVDPVSKDPYFKDKEFKVIRQTWSGKRWEILSPDGTSFYFPGEQLRLVPSARFKPGDQVTVKQTGVPAKVVYGYKDYYLCSTEAIYHGDSLAPVALDPNPGKYKPGDKVLCDQHPGQEFTVVGNAEWRNDFNWAPTNPLVWIRGTDNNMHKVPEGTLKPATKFKPGDKVTANHNEPFYSGTTFTVTGYDASGGYRVQGSKGARYLFPESSLDPAPKFQVGDWVHHVNGTPGMWYMVSEIKGDGYLMVTTADRKEYKVLECNLTPAVPKYKRGDKVKGGAVSTYVDGGLYLLADKDRKSFSRYEWELEPPAPKFQVGDEVRHKDFPGEWFRITEDCGNGYYGYEGPESFGVGETADFTPAEPKFQRGDKIQGGTVAKDDGTRVSMTEETMEPRKPQVGDIVTIKGKLPPYRVELGPTYENTYRCVSLPTGSFEEVVHLDDLTLVTEVPWFPISYAPKDQWVEVHNGTISAFRINPDPELWDKWRPCVGEHAAPEPQSPWHKISECQPPKTNGYWCIIKGPIVM